MAPLGTKVIIPCRVSAGGRACRLVVTRQKTGYTVRVEHGGITSHLTSVMGQDILQFIHECRCGKTHHKTTF